jgi:hypothetical protein
MFRYYQNEEKKEKSIEIIVRRMWVPNSGRNNRKI